MLSAGAGAWVLPRISMWSPSWWKPFRKPSSWNINMSSERIFQPQRSSGYSKTRVHLQKIWGWSLEMHQNLVQVEREPHEPMNANWGSGIDLEIPAESDGANGFRYFKEKDESKSSCDKYMYVIYIREYESCDSMKLWFILVWMYLRHQCDTPLQGIFLKPLTSCVGPARMITASSSFTRSFEVWNTSIRHRPVWWFQQLLCLLVNWSNGK